MQKPHKGKITSQLGSNYKGPNEKRPKHAGIDISVKDGDAIYAVVDGTVTKAGWQDEKDKKKGYGLRIYIDHGDKVVTIYAHLKENSLCFNVGDKVKKGDKITEGDNTGHSTGSHLHFEIRTDSNVENPQDWLIDTCKEPKGTTTDKGTSTIIIARDPNAMYGPEGYVYPGQELTYTVEFENEGEGIAYGVYITDPLDESLDDSTLEVFDCTRIDYENDISTSANFDWRYNSSMRILTVFVDNDGEVLSKHGGKFSYRIKVNSNAQPGTVITKLCYSILPIRTRDNKDKCYCFHYPIFY